MIKNTSRRILEDSSFFRFFNHHARPFGKISFLVSLVEVFFVGLNAFFWCPKVPCVLKNTSTEFWKIQDFCDFFHHRGPSGKSHFWHVFSKCFVLV